ncbi:MAG: radical SAM protein, partial [Oscillospiraceae bacterium]|nr:radical SAM protein [Oscillospiraceae bacterium]
MEHKIIEDRNNVKRFVSADIDRQLIQMRGVKFAAYRNEFDLARSKHIRPDRPTDLYLELVSWCNLSCKMCMRSFKKITPESKSFMSMEMVEKLSAQAKELQIPTIWLGAFTEPTLHPNFAEVTRKFAEAQPLDYWLTTNGTLLSDSVCELITDIPLTKLCVSLDAATPQNYKRIRGGDLDTVERNIHRFLEIREKKKSKLPFLRVTFVEQDDNRDEFESFVEKWRNIADVVDLQKLFDFSLVGK